MRHSLFVALVGCGAWNCNSNLGPSCARGHPIVAPVEVKAAPVAPPKIYFSYVEYNKEYRKKNAAELNAKQVRKYEANKAEILLAKNLRKLNLD